MSSCRVRTDVFHHCLVPVTAVISGLDTIEDWRQRCLDVARCDAQSSKGEGSVCCLLVCQHAQTMAASPGLVWRDNQRQVLSRQFKSFLAYTSMNETQVARLLSSTMLSNCFHMLCECLQGASGSPRPQRCWT